MFWRKTPVEVSLIVAARAVVIERQHQQIAWHAWHVAALSRTTKMPKLEVMLGTGEKRQTWQEAQATMALWAKVVNGKSN